MTRVARITTNVKEQMRSGQENAAPFSSVKRQGQGGGRAETLPYPGPRKSIVTCCQADGIAFTNTFEEHARR